MTMNARSWIPEECHRRELTQFFTTEGLSAKSVESDFHGSQDDELIAFFSERFVGGFEALKRGE